MIGTYIIIAALGLIQFAALTQVAFDKTGAGVCK